MLESLELHGDFSKECAGARIGHSILKTHPHRFANGLTYAPVADMASGVSHAWPAPHSTSYIRLGHKLVYVVIVAILDARADAPGPRGPAAVAYPALPEGG